MANMAGPSPGSTMDPSLRTVLSSATLMNGSASPPPASIATTTTTTSKTPAATAATTIAAGPGVVGAVPMFEPGDIIFEDDASASMTTSWGDCLEKNDDDEDDDRQGRENRDEFADQPVVAGYKQRSADGQPTSARHRSVGGSCVSEDSGL